MRLRLGPPRVERAVPVTTKTWFDWPSCLGSYTEKGMKTTVSIPDDVFEEAERLAAELETSRSQLYSCALQEFVARHAPDRLTEAMNRVVAGVGTEVDEFSQRAARRVLEQVEW
jgi:metal-responsive CopG/Arc/MetJ family transcriptional regulator